MTRIDTREWKEFKIGDLFDYATGNFDIQPIHLSDEGIPVVSAGTANNGIIGKTTVNSIIIPPGTITVDMFGHAFFRNYTYTMVTYARVFALIPKTVKLASYEGSFVVGVLNRFFRRLITLICAATRR